MSVDELSPEQILAVADVLVRVFRCRSQKTDRPLSSLVDAWSGIAEHARRGRPASALPGRDRDLLRQALAGGHLDPIVRAAAA